MDDQSVVEATFADHETDDSIREVRFRHSEELPGLLAQLCVSLIVSTYQAGKLVVVAATDAGLDLSFHNFESAMGVAVHPGKIAVGARNQVWFLHNASGIASNLDPPGRHDACFLARSSHVTGEIQGHEMAWVGDELWVVNTLFSCLCNLDGEHSFVPRWRPPFVTALAAEDRCHLNGLAIADGQPRYVTAFGQTDSPRGWRANKATEGCLIDVTSSELILGDLCMPHSPRVHQGRVWLLNSGHGSLAHIDTAAGKAQTVTKMPGYTRGLAFHDRFAFVGLSKIRETSTFGGVPIGENRDELKCGVGVVDLTSGRQVAHLEFQSGVEEIFDVRVMPGIRRPAFSGPYASADGTQPIWMVPAPTVDGAPAIDQAFTERVKTPAP